MIDKSKAVWDWLYEGCKDIKDLYFNFAEGEDGNTVLMPETAYSDEWEEDMPFIDGTGFKKAVFSLACFEAYTTDPNSETNITAHLNVQKIAEWIDKQDKRKNYPVFPPECEIQKIKVLPFENGGIDEVYENGVKYMFSMQIDYFYNKEE